MSNISVFIDPATIEKRISELAEQITNDYKDKSITLICVLKGSVIFMASLAKKLRLDTEFEFMSVSSYENTDSTGIVKIETDLKSSIYGKDVLLVEDIIDTGHTLSHLVKHLKSKEPASLKMCTLLDKPERRVVNDVNPEYIGFTIPDKFVVGYGLDYNQKYRHLDYIGILEV